MSVKSVERKARDAANMRAWRADNRERAREIDRRGREKNVEAIKETKKRCYEKHRAQNLAYAAVYREANFEAIKQKTDPMHATYSARYRARHYEKCLAMTQAWKDSHPIQRKETNSAWAEKNYDKRRADAQNRRKRIGNGMLSAYIGPRLYELQRGRCACCGVELNGNYELDHIMPLYLGGAHEDENIQLLTRACNRRKRAQHPITYMQAKGMLL